MVDTNMAIVKWNEVSTALVLYTEKQDEKTLGECIEIMFGAIKFVAPYASTVASIVKPMVIPDQVMVELNKINDKLFNIDKKLDKIVGEIKEEFKINEYRMYLNKLNTIQALYTRFIQTPNTLTLDALIEQSKRNEMFEFINWIHREVTAQSMNPIIDFMKADYDYPKFMKWTKLILAHFAQSMLLHGIGVQLRPNVSEEILDQTIQSDATLFDKNLREIQTVFTEFIEYLKKSYLEKLNEKLFIFVKSLPNLDEQALANVMYEYVSDNYPFREWFVCAIKSSNFVLIRGSSETFSYDYENEQTIRFIVCEKNGNRMAMSVKDFEDMDNSISFEKRSYINKRVIYITSTTAADCQYRQVVNNYLSSIDENTYYKFDETYGDRRLTYNTIRVVSDGMPTQYASQILCLSSANYERFKYSYKYSDRAMICFHKRPIKRLFGLVSYDLEIITIKKD